MHKDRGGRRLPRRRGGRGAGRCRRALPRGSRREQRGGGARVGGNPGDAPRAGTDGHGGERTRRSWLTAAQERWRALAAVPGTLVLLMAMGNLDGIARALIDGRRPADEPAAAIHGGTTREERTVLATLATLAERCRQEGLGNPAVVVVGPVVALPMRTPGELRTEPSSRSPRCRSASGQRPNVSRAGLHLVSPPCCPVATVANGPPVRLPIGHRERPAAGDVAGPAGTRPCRRSARAAGDRMATRPSQRRPIGRYRQTALPLGPVAAVVSVGGGRPRTSW
jgi:hypothetical protein